MKAFCDGGDLAEAVGKAIRAISNKSNNPILDNIRIEASEGTLMFTATDNELTALDVLNMLVPEAFSDKEKEQWKSLPKETRKAVMDMVLTYGGTQWDALNEAQKAVIHEYSNAK